MAIDYELVYLDYLNHSKEIFAIARTAANEEQELMKKTPLTFEYNDISMVGDNYTKFKQYRVYQDFIDSLANIASHFYIEDGGYYKHSQVYNVNSNISKRSLRGEPDPFWSTLNYLLQAEIYYLAKQYVEADYFSQKALQGFLFLDPDLNLERDILLEKMLQYFTQTAADVKISKMLGDIVFTNLTNNTYVFSNKYSELKILYWLYYISPKYLEDLGISPEALLQDAIQLDLINQTKLSGTLNNIVALKALDIFFDGQMKEATTYYQHNKYDYPAPGYGWLNVTNNFADGLINESKHIPHEEVKMFRDYVAKHLPNDDYNYLYSQVYYLALVMIGKKNKGENYSIELSEIIDYLHQIVNIDHHSPGTTIPGLHHENSLLLELIVNIAIDSKLSLSDKEKIIEASSSLSLDFNEQVFIQNQDLMQNTKNDYAKQFATELVNFSTKRNGLYDDLYKDFFNGVVLKKSARAELDIINEQIANAQLYLYQNKLIKTDQDEKSFQLKQNELLINTFCLAKSCYIYSRSSTESSVKKVSKEILFNINDSLIVNINEKKNFSNELTRLGSFLFPDTTIFNGKTSCLIVSTSGTNNIPIDLTKFGNAYLIDKCKVINYTSLQHLKRRESAGKKIEYKKWALAIADPIIEDKTYSDSIKKTASLIRGGDIDQLPELPETFLEAKMIVSPFEKESVLLHREKATKDNLLKENLSDYHILSFSTHGLAAGEFEGASLPSILLTGDDNLLTTNDILDLSGISKIVLLGICNASKDNLKIKLNPNEISNIASTFITKGSKVVLSTRWSLNSQASLYILSHALKQYYDGQLFSKALHSAVMDYRKNFPQSSPSDWGAFILYGDISIEKFNKVAAQEGIGAIPDLYLHEDNILVPIIYPGGQTIIKTFNSDLLLVKEIFQSSKVNDIKFIVEGNGDFIKLSNEGVSLFKNINGKYVNHCHISNKDQATFGFFSSTVKYNQIIFYTIKNIGDSNMRIGYINESDCTNGTANINLQNESWIHDTTAFRVEGDNVYILGIKELPKEGRLYTINYSTFSGTPNMCQFYRQLQWAKLQISDDGELSLQQGPEDFSNGYLLPLYSNTSLSHFTLKDFCSSSQRFITLDSIFNARDIRGEKVDLVIGEEPRYQFIGKISGNSKKGNLLLSLESSFMSSIRNDFLYYMGNQEEGGFWSKLTKKQDLDNYSVIAVSGGEKKFISKSNQCHDFYGIRMGEKNIVACNTSENNGMSKYRLFIN
ncbi:MAG: CHAT domain-containing protein [Flavobacteriaceae bacterium]|nr:CHAT domain-containing protein [Flavobacteriaceae bacterium]